MKLTSVTSVTPRSTRNVVRIETPATASGSTARKLAKTNASTTSAPTAPIMVSAITPLPGLAGVAFSSWRSPVIRTAQPAGAAAWTARATVMSAGCTVSGWFPGVNISANVLRPPALTKARSPVVA